MANNIVLELENKAILSLTNYNELKAKADTLQELCTRAQKAMKVELDESYMKFPSLMPVSIEANIELPIAVKGAMAKGFVNGVKAADEETRSVLMKWVLAGDRHFFDVRSRDLVRSESDEDTYDLNNIEDWCMMVDTYKEAQDDDSDN